ncbi:hypothetical protein D3C86_1417080 [compost metagenome]
MERMAPDMRPWVVKVRIWPCIFLRSRMVVARLSRISARLPPVWRWMMTAMPKISRSSLGMRSSQLRMATSRAVPTRNSCRTSETSADMGSVNSSTTSSRACWTLLPAFTALATTPTMSGSCSSKSLQYFR